MPSKSRARLSIIVPVLDEAEHLGDLLQRLLPARNQGAEVIVVDGGSVDGTREVAAQWSDRVVESTPGRARQMNLGAHLAHGGRLWFLHADSVPPPDGVDRIDEALAGRPWGRFDVRLSGDRRMLRVVAASMNRRSRWTGICTGDQGLFFDRGVFETLGGFPDQQLMEDVALSALARKAYGWPACLPGPLVTSSRRWEVHGIWPTIVAMWRLRLAYALGASPESLHRQYYGRS